MQLFSKLHSFKLKHLLVESNDLLIFSLQLNLNSFDHLFKNFDFNIFRFDLLLSINLKLFMLDFKKSEFLTQILYLILQVSVLRNQGRIDLSFHFNYKFFSGFQSLTQDLNLKVQIAYVADHIHSVLLKFIQNLVLSL